MYRTEPKTEIMKSLEKGGNRIYYNVTVPYNNDLPASDIGIMRFRETRQQPLINNPSDYYIAVERFELPSQSLPLLQMETNVGSLNITPYTIGFEFDDGTTQLFNEVMVYVPNNTLTNGGTTAASKTNSYYNIFSYSHVLDMINTTMQDAWNNLWAAESAFLGANGYVNEAPYFEYDDDNTGLIYLITQYAMRQNFVKIVCNWQMRSRFLDGFESFYRPQSGVKLSAVPDAYQILVKNRDNNAYAKPGIALTNPPAYLKQVQEYKTLDRWNGVDAIVLTTSTIPVSNEYLSNSGSSLNPKVSGSTNTIKLLTDFEALFAGAGDARQTLTYAASGQYKLMDMDSTSPMTNFDFQLWWRDVDGKLHPMFLSPSDSFNIKFAFIKKETFFGG